ncbi:hypothetical protein N7517_010144 [Penicillium concentricum]|uniref:Uncharacterized protein n=1 Tax=Penicillium concentricum TaxID=293559 RepID=A0A9W9UX93_9EURO|nr:uncharacterized protein N7517_010144 [Penicillium concentricum]KAJ5360953.1 hypothetical protein N7517_010144 [Penicillium concentricum]
MDSTGNTVENITSSMDNVALADTTYTVYLVKIQSSHPEGGLAILVKINKDVGDIHFIAPNSDGDDLHYHRVSIQPHEIGEIPMPIGTTLAKDYPSSWDEALKQLPLLANSNQQDMLTLLASPLKVSQWTRLARAMLENAGILMEFEAAPIMFRVEI